MDDKNSKSANLVLAYSTIGLQLAATILICIYGGYKLDEQYETTPLFLIILAFFGLALGFYFLIRNLRDIEKLKIIDSDKTSRKNKWLSR